jgi:hypothetical protein
VRGRAATLRLACRWVSNADSGSGEPACGAGEGFDGDCDGAGVAVGQPVPVRWIDHPLAPTRRPVMAGEPPSAVGGEGVNADLVSTGRVDLDLQLDPLTGPDQAGGHRVAAGFETDQAVFPDPPQMLLRHQIRLLRQR